MGHRPGRAASPFSTTAPGVTTRRRNTSDERRRTGRAVSTAAPIAPVDISGLYGFSYACRPQCGLCCYAEPLVGPAEKAGLLRIVPSAEFTARGRFEFLRSHSDGGACRLLEGDRCRAHSARPSMCREYPLSAHVGLRVQATISMTCPGVDLSALHGYRGPDRGAPPHGFDTELTALRARVDGSVRRLLENNGRRQRHIERVLGAAGRWTGDEEVRGRLRGQIPLPAKEDFPVGDPPSQDDGLASLPLFFDRHTGLVALAGGTDGWEVVTLYPTGGVRSSLGVVPPPGRPPALSEDAAGTLAGYLRYWLERDLLFGIVHLAMLETPEGSVTDHVRAELREIAAVTLSRAQVLATLRGGGGVRLSEEEVREGIRATDQDLLDQETWGTRL